MKNMILPAFITGQMNTDLVVLLAVLAIILLLAAII